jgi:spermidine synthase
MPLVRFFRKAPPWAMTAAALVLALAAAWLAPSGLARGAAFQVPGQLELDEVSNYSHVKVTRDRGTRTLWFVRDNGEHVVESKLDLDRPDDLLIEYTRYMFLSYVFRPEPKKVLIVGLGGGSMVHFLQVHDPKVKVDVVEIDPLIVSIADRYFGVKTGGNVDVKVTDGFAYLRESDAKYDVIYMDAFLRPSGGTDITGVPLHLKTLAFYEQIKKRLNPDGAVVFNLNPHIAVQQDIRTIREAFPNTYVFRLKGYEGFVVVASTAAERMTPTAVSAAAARLDNNGRFKAPFSFREMAGRLSRR